MLLFKMLLKGNSVAIVKYKFILTIPTSTKNPHFHDSVLSM